MLLYGDLISVVIPVYNRAHAVSRSVGSICAQSYKNLDIIVVDDCSSDDIVGAIKSLNDPRIRLLRHKKNGGASAARNTGISAAEGKLVAFHDSDDVSIFDRLERQMKLLSSLPSEYIGVYSALLSYTIVPEEAYSQSSSHMLPPAHRSPLSGDLFRGTLEGNFVNTPTMLLKKNAVLSAHSFDERLRNNVDWDFTLRLTQQGKLQFISQPLYLAGYATHKTTTHDHISHNSRYSSLSYSYITGKMRRAGFSGPELSNHYISTGSHLMRIGRPKLARRYFHAARTNAQNGFRVWMHIVLSYSPRLHAWARRSR